MLSGLLRQADADRLDRAGGNSSLDLLAQRIVGSVVELQGLLPVEAEHRRRGVDALSVALAAHQIDDDSHVDAPSSCAPQRLSRCAPSRRVESQSGKTASAVVIGPNAFLVNQAFGEIRDQCAWTGRSSNPNSRLEWETDRGGDMNKLLCRVLGHRRARVVFSTNRFYCSRCGLDLRP